MKLTITKDFSYWHKGVNRADYAAGTEVETDDEEMVQVAVTEGWAEPEGAEKRSTKAQKNAPENKSS